MKYLDLHKRFWDRPYLRFFRLSSWMCKLNSPFNLCPFQRWSVYMLDKIHWGLQGDALGRCHVQGGPDISFPWLHGVPARLHRQLAVCHLGQRLFTDAGLPMGHQDGPVCPISGAEYPGTSIIFSGFHWRPGVPARIQLQGKNTDIWAPYDRFEHLNPS